MTTVNETRPSASPTPPKRLRGRQIPAEGTDGLFSEGWYPICLSQDVSRGKIHSIGFLDGRVVAIRGGDDVVRVFSAYCMHLGANLESGEQTEDGNGIRCRFHGWEYGVDGKCVHLPSGDPIPPRAQLYTFTAQEMYGIVFVYNGLTPRFELPTFPFPENQIAVKAGAIPDLFPVDPWVISANTPDLLHITALHQFEMLNDPFEAATWQDYSATFPVHAKLPTGQDFDVTATIHGTNYFLQTGEIDGRWFGWAAPLGIPAVGQTQLFTIIAALPKPGETEEETNAFLDYALGIELGIASEDMPIFSTMHYTPGNLTRGDRVLARFFEYLRNFPKAHPSADFIN